MRVIDRLQQYLTLRKISMYSFERTTKVANGYLKKQLKGKGSIGSDILERIAKNYFDLNLVWLITGEEDMLFSESDERNTGRLSLRDDALLYAREDLVRSLRERISQLEAAVADKEKIIRLLDEQMHPGKRK